MDYEKKDIHEQGAVDNRIEEIALDDERRIKVLSPTMLVFKRFIRNKLAITGAIIIGFMFIFAFVGGWLMPYAEDQTFTKYVDMQKDYAAVSVNRDYKYTEVEGAKFPLAARSEFVLAVSKNGTDISSDGIDYTIEKLGQDFYRIYQQTDIAVATKVGKNYNISITGDVGKGFEAEFKKALENGDTQFTSGQTTYVVIQKKKTFHAAISNPVAIASKYMFDFATADADSGYEFRYQAELAMNEVKDRGGKGTITFTANGKQYEMEVEDDTAVIFAADDYNAVYANISRYIVQATYPDVFLSIDFKTQVKELISEDASEFIFTEADGTARRYTIVRNNEQWNIKWTESTLVFDDYHSPTWAHPLGTDGSGMDVLTRLMYGGRISLMIGFIVVLIETLIGVVVGGLAGYFKKHMDNALMRVVDVFNSIPSLPLIIILGAMMDEMRVDPQARMIYLMVILGLLGWPGIARMVRGQILSLREQEFMTAAEATGISATSRIFKHLVPNVIPQLIVICTMDLGNIILLESTLSFLGLGVKFPFASWGNIINDVNNVFVLTNYPFVWIPAGFCILITVLGFNFVGDGLRDAFDPKMKR